ncbi:DUF6602 domain-containing protein [Pseudomonas alliivorans]|nr:DUF6602 domain-containing protein [Pseudomonas alliivorans]
MIGNSWASFISARVESLILESRSITEIFDHNGIRGSIRELFVKQFLEPFLPPQIGIGTGEIINHEGLKSRQLDVVLYNKHRVPPILVSGSDTGIFPWECVIAVIEVKSTVTIKALNEAHINANSVAATYDSVTESDLRIGNKKPKYNMPYYTPIPYYVFGFTTDIKGKAAASEIIEKFVGGTQYSLGREGYRLQKTLHDLTQKRMVFEGVISNKSSTPEQVAKAKTKLAKCGGEVERFGQKINGICVAGREWSTGSINFADQIFSEYGDQPIRVANYYNHYWHSKFSGSRKKEALAFLNQIIELSYEMPKCREHFDIARYLS